MHVRRLTITLALLGFLAPIGVLPSAAQQLVFESFPVSAVVRGENIRLRLDPAAETEVVSVLQRGDAITITDESVLADGDEYYPVDVDLTGESGWIRALFIDPRGLTAGATTVVVPLEDVEPDETADEGNQDRQSRRQARQADAAPEPEPEPEPEAEEPADDRAARRAERQGNNAAPDAQAEQPADDRAARRAAREAEQNGNANAGNAASDELTFSGSESTVTPEFTAPSDVLTVTANHEGDGDFRVRATTTDGIQEVLFNETGPFSGETTLEIEPGSLVTLDVEASGAWEVVVTPAA